MVTQPNLIGMTVPGGSEGLSVMRLLGWDIPVTEPAGRAERHEMTVSPLQNTAGRIPRHDPGCFPGASPALTQRAGKQKTAPRDRINTLISLRKYGAGEGIRTLDPNLGQVCGMNARYFSGEGGIVTSARIVGCRLPQPASTEHGRQAVVSAKSPSRNQFNTENQSQHIPTQHRRQNQSATSKSPMASSAAIRPFIRNDRGCARC